MSERKGREQEGREVTVIDHLRALYEEARRKVQEKIREKRIGELFAFSSRELEEEVNRAAEKRQKELVREAEEERLQRLRGRRRIRSRDKVLVMFSSPERETEAQRLASIITVFFQTLRSEIETEPAYLPSDETRRLLLKKLAEEDIDREVTSANAVYFAKILNKIYNRPSSNITQIVDVNTLIRLYALDSIAGEKLYRAVKEVAQERGLDISEYKEKVDEELAKMGLLHVKLTKQDIEDLGKLWDKIERIKQVVRSVYLRRVQDLENIRDEIDDYEARFRRLQDEFKEVIKRIEEGADDGDLARLNYYLQDWARRDENHNKLRPEEKRVLEFTSEEMDRYYMLTSRAKSETEAFLQGIAGFLDPEALGIDVRLFEKISVVSVAANFKKWFKWNEKERRLEFKSLELYKTSLKILHEYFTQIGISASEEWGQAIDQQAMTILIRAIRLSFGNIIRAVDHEIIERELDLIARENNVSLSEVKDQFKQLISNARQAFENEYAAQGITHEGSRLLLKNELHSTDQLQKLMIKFDADRAIGVFGGLDSILIDIASRLFSQYVGFYAAQHDGKIRPEFFRAFYKEGVLSDFIHIREFREIYKQVVRSLIQETIAQGLDPMEIFGVSSIEEIEPWRLERALRLGVGRSMLFEARAPAVMGLAEAWEGFEDQLAILSFFGFPHQWLWGRGGEKLESRLKWLFDLELRDDPGGMAERLKPWTPSEVLKQLEEGKITTLEELEKAVSSYGPEAVRRFREGKRYTFRDLLREFSFADLISRGGWRLQILKEIYKERYGEEFKPSEKSYRRIIANWGLAFLFDFTEKRVENEIKGKVLEKFLGGNYEGRYTDKKISSEKRKIFEEKKYPFRTHEGKEIYLTPQEFIEKKKLFYEGKLFFWLLQRAPVDFLNVVMRLIPEFASVKRVKVDDEERLISPHIYYFDDDFLNKMREQNIDEYKKILEFRLKLQDYWDGANFTALSKVAETWYNLQKEGFREIMRRRGLSDEEIEKLWESEGENYLDEVKRQLFAADFAASQRLILSTQNLTDEQIQDDRNLIVERYLSDRGIEGVIKRVVFGEGGLVEFFNSQHLDFADTGVEADNFRLGKDNFFVNLADTWLNYKAKRVIPSFAESRLDNFFRRATVVGNMVFARNWGDNHNMLKGFTEALGALPSAFKELGTKGTINILKDKVLKNIANLKPWLGSEKVTSLNTRLMFAATRYTQADWRLRLPFPFNLVTGLYFRLFKKGEESLNRMIEGTDAAKFYSNDEDTRRIIREASSEGFIKVKQRELLEKVLGVSTDIYIMKFTVALLFTFGIFLLYKMIKEAWEGEEKEK